MEDESIKECTWVLNSSWIPNEKQLMEKQFHICQSSLKPRNHMNLQKQIPHPFLFCCLSQSDGFFDVGYVSKNIRAFGEMQ